MSRNYYSVVIVLIDYAARPRKDCIRCTPVKSDVKVFNVTYGKCYICILYSILGIESVKLRAISCIVKDCVESIGGIVVTSNERIRNNTVKLIYLFGCYCPLIICAMVGNITHTEYVLDILRILVSNYPIVEVMHIVRIIVNCHLSITYYAEGICIIGNGSIIVSPNISYVSVTCAILILKHCVAVAENNVAYSNFRYFIKLCTVLSPNGNVFRLQACINVEYSCATKKCGSTINKNIKSTILKSCTCGRHINYVKRCLNKAVVKINVKGVTVSFSGCTARIDKRYLRKSYITIVNCKADSLREFSCSVAYGNERSGRCCRNTPISVINRNVVHYYTTYTNIKQIPVSCVCTLLYIKIAKNECGVRTSELGLL